MQKGAARAPIARELTALIAGANFNKTWRQPGTQRSDGAQGQNNGAKNQKPRTNSETTAAAMRVRPRLLSLQPGALSTYAGVEYGGVIGDARM